MGEKDRAVVEDVMKSLVVTAVGTGSQRPLVDAFKAREDRQLM